MTQKKEKQETTKARLERIKEILNELEDELAVISVQFNLPTGEQSYLTGNFAKIRTDLETLIEEKKK